MLAGVDVDSLSLAGAFLLGAILATIATLRLVRIVIDFLVRRDRRDDPGTSPPRRP